VTTPPNTKPFPAAALVVVFHKSHQWNGMPMLVDAKLVPIQVFDFYRAVAALPLRKQER
jgi:hypothetical protein